MSVSDLGAPATKLSIYCWPSPPYGALDGPSYALLGQRDMSMILYKYVPFDGGCKILNDKTIGYSNPWDFNDPFEMAASHGVLPDSALAPLVLKLLMQRSTILSLTRGCPILRAAKGGGRRLSGERDGASARRRSGSEVPRAGALVLRTRSLALGF